MELLGSYYIPSINFLLISTSIALFVWYYLKEKYSYWNTRGVYSLSPLRCIIDTFEFTFQRKPFFQVFCEQYDDLEGHKYGGTFQLGNPCLLVRDPEAIKNWLIKGFTSFHDRGPVPDEDGDALSGNLFQLTGEKWHQVRHKISPAFSSAKLRIMYQTLKGVSEELSTYLKKLCSDTGEVEINVKELMSNYTMDVIGACAMGIKCNAIQDPNCELKQIIEKMFRFDFRRSVYQIFQLLHPKLPKLLRLRAVEPEIEEFLTTICRKAIEMKSSNGASNRKDFLQILMNIRSSEVEKMKEPTDQKMSEDLEKDDEKIETIDDSGEGPIFTEKIMVGVISSFLSAGFEPVAAVLTFCLYELALQPAIQEKILKEIETVKKTSGKEDITFEDLKKCTYTEQVINETLRKYPVAGVLSRHCAEPFKIPDSSVVVEKDVTVFVPVHSLHYDAKYFPEPKKFDPDRFSEENIDKIVPGSYLPFGDGPRFCIAMRLAIMDVKTMVLTMVSNFTLHPCARTQTKMEFNKKIFTLSPEGGVWLKVKKRK